MERFDAFISYSHAADGQLAPAVQKGLQRLAKGVFERRALRVFRDESALTTNPHLWESLTRALTMSEWFVLFASPQSASSTWVQREVEVWLRTKPLARLLVVVTDGVLAFTDEGRVDEQRTDCLPPCLVAQLEAEPRWLDLRWARDDDQLDLRNARFRDAIADLAATIHGVSKDDLESEDVRQQKRARRLAISGVFVIAALAGAAVIVALVALDQRRQAAAERDVARDQRARADIEAARAIARSLAAQATALAPTSLDVSLLLGVEAYRRDPTIESASGLLTALESARWVRTIGNLHDAVVDLDASADGSALYVLTDRGDVQRFDPGTMRPHGRPLVTGIVRPFNLDVSADGSTLAFGSAQGAGVVDLVGGDILHTELGGTGPAVLAPSGELVAVAVDSTSTVHVYDVVAGSPICSISHAGMVALAFSSDSDLVLSELGGPALSVHAIERDRCAAVGGAHELPVPGGGLEVSPDGSVIVAGGFAGDVVLLDAATLQPRTPSIRTRGSRAEFFAFNRSGTLVALSSDDGSATVVDTTSGDEVGMLTGLTGALVSVFSGETSLVSASISARIVAEWSVDVAPPIGSAASVGGVDGVVTLEDGTVVLAVGGHLEVASPEDLETPRRTRSLGTNVTALASSDVAGLLAAAVFDSEGREVRQRRLHVVDARTLDDVAVVELVATAESIAFDPDGSSVAVGFEDGRVGVYDSSTGRALLEPLVVDTYPCCVRALAWSADGSRLHAGGQDGVLRALDASSWAIVAENTLTPRFPLTRATVGPDGTRAVVPSESGEIFVVDTTTGHPEATTFIAAGTQLQTAAMLPSGRVIVAQSRDGKLRLWDVDTQRPIGPALSGHAGLSGALAVLSDSLVLTGGRDGAVISWSLDARSWIDRACAKAGRNLSVDEWARYVGGAYALTCEQWPDPR